MERISQNGGIYIIKVKIRPFRYGKEAKIIQRGEDLKLKSDRFDMESMLNTAVLIV